MWLFDNRKYGNSRIVKICNKVIYIVTNGYHRRIQRFLGNFISTYKIENKNTETKIVKILNAVVQKRVVDEDYKKEYVFGHLIKTIDLKQQFMKKYGKYFNKYKNIFILNANSGEAYLFLTYVIDAFIKKYHCENIILVATKKYHLDLIEMLCSEIPHVYLKNFNDFNHSCTQINDKKFYMFFTGKHFIKVEDNIKNSPLNTSNYFDAILNDLNINQSELNYRKMKISDNIQKSMMKKIAKTKLNLDNFIFVAPEAVSCEEYDNEFWVDLVNKFHEENTDIFMNIVDNDTDIVGCDYKTCKLNFSEAFALAKLSKGVVSLRSGLTETLLQTDVPIFSLYTNFRRRQVFNDMDVEYVLSGFGLSKLPNINPNKLHEFNMSEMINDEVVEKIISKIANKNTLEKVYETI